MNETDALGREYWTWRAAQQPRSPDDIPRIDRPSRWRPRWSAADVAGYRVDLEGFEARSRSLATTDDRAELVDRRLLQAAFARVHWELDVLRMWQTQPGFYVNQTIGNVFDLLTQPDPDAERLIRVVAVLEATQAILRDGRANLTEDAVAEFARLTITELSDIEAQVSATVRALTALPTAVGLGDLLTMAGENAAQALGDFRQWLHDAEPKMAPMRPIGRELFQWFLTDVALVPSTPDEMLAIGRAELARAITLETLERNRNLRAGLVHPEPPGNTPEEQSAAEAEAELQVRRFYVERGILSQPDTLHHYLNAPLPAYLAPIRWLGVTDDLTGPDRVDEDGISYVPTFTGQIPYFYAANAEDPRAGIVHEGAHYQQLALSWRHPRPLRRHYYDSVPNEGVAYYNEEMMLASGLFDEAPRSREIMYNFMRLRALRIEVDVRLALGEFDIPQAAAYLEGVVPMDAKTAHEEAAFFAAYPGQALTYQIGKTQILRLFADAVRADPAGFDLQLFHDRLWLEGNVPLSLQRWELLDDDSDLLRIEALSGHVSFEPDNAIVSRRLVTSDDSGGDLSATWVQIDGSHRRLRTSSATRLYYVLDGTLIFTIGEGAEPESIVAGGHCTIPRGVEYGVAGQGRYLVLNGPAFEDGDDEYV